MILKKDQMRLKEEKKLQEDFNKLLEKMRKGIKRAKQIKTLTDIDMLF